MIFYYSRTQKTKIAAEALHEITGMPLYALDAQISEAKGILFIWRAMRSVMGKKGCPVDNMPASLPGEIYLCGPIWAGAPAGPLKYFITRANLSGIKVHVLLTGLQPSEQTRTSTRKQLERAGCRPGKVYLIATQKTPPEKDILTEHLRELMKVNES
jgi:hypothetical protein